MSNTRIDMGWLIRRGSVSATFVLLAACVSGGETNGSGSTEAAAAGSSSGTEMAAASNDDAGATADSAPGRVKAAAVGDKAQVNGPYVIQNRSNVIVENVRIVNPNGPCLRVLSSSNITIRNVELMDCKGVGVDIQKSNNVAVENSYFQNLNGGVYAYYSTAIRVNGNRFKNVDRARLDHSRGQFVQFNGVSGPGNQINNNRGVNEPGRSSPEDLVNLFASSGTSASPIQVLGNCFKGGGPSTSGGGIIMGDGGGGNVVVRENTLVDVGQYGIAIAGGQNSEISGNRIYGRRQGFTNVGVYVWNQYRGACSNHKVFGNQIDFTNARGARNPMWNGNNCGGVTGWTQNTTKAALSTLSCSI